MPHTILESTEPISSLQTPNHSVEAQHSLCTASDSVVRANFPRREKKKKFKQSPKLLCYQTSSLLRPAGVRLSTLRDAPSAQQRVENELHANRRAADHVSKKKKEKKTCEWERGGAKSPLHVLLFLVYWTKCLLADNVCTTGHIWQKAPEQCHKMHIS